MTTNHIDRRFVALTAPDTFAAERYQGLRIKLEQLRQRDNKRVIAITSPGAGDGKTLTSVNLAGVLGNQSNSRVLLIDADLRRSSVGESLGIAAGTSGLADLIAGSTKRAFPALVQWPSPCKFDVLPAGSSSLSIQDLFRSPKLTEILDEARQRYDYILLDTPPLIPVFDAAVLSRTVDGVIVVVAADRTPRKMLAAALDLLDPSTVVGIVFNGDNSPLFRYNNRAYRGYFTSRSQHA
jgi:capsular exopolysaccharide synthesis family protein